MVNPRTKKQPVEPKEKKIEINRKDYPSIKGKLKYADQSIDEIAVASTIEYLTPVERVHFMNELYRVLRPNGKVMILTPYWSASKAYADLAYQFPPVSESWYFTLNAEWRNKNFVDEVIPKELKLTCDFDVTWGYGMHQLIQSRNQEYQQHAIIFWKEAAQDLMATLIKR